MEFREIEHIMITQTLVKSLSDYIDAINHISHTFSDTLWFRGHSKDSYENLPSIYREQTWINDKYSYDREYELLKTFKRKSKLQKETDFEYLHLMQHFGLPTRLLDWTESSLIALFFAIHNPDKCENPTVWILDPWRLNEFFHKENIVFDFFGKSVHPKIDKYLNPIGDEYFMIPEEPIAVLPSFYDDRVISQKSGFILFGKNKTPLEKLVQGDDYFDMAKIIIDTNSARDILIDLNLAGVDYHSVFPDIEGLVKETKKKWDLR